MGLIVNACVYCGRKAEGNYSIERDGTGSHPAVPLCDRCGSQPRPSILEILARVAMTDDDGEEWGPKPHRCDGGQS
jgi:hypothetical protein